MLWTSFKCFKTNYSITKVAGVFVNKQVIHLAWKQKLHPVWLVQNLLLLQKWFQLPKIKSFKTFSNVLISKRITGVTGFGTIAVARTAPVVTTPAPILTASKQYFVVSSDILIFNKQTICCSNWNKIGFRKCSRLNRPTYRL